jgi:hypothetical protein
VRLPHSFDVMTLSTQRIVPMSPDAAVGIICIAYPWVRREPHCAKAAELAVENRANDTDDTKPSSRDTPTIQPVPTMSVAGVTDVDFVEATDRFVPSTRARSGSK